MTIIVVSNDAYKRMLMAVRESEPDIAIPIVRYKPVPDIKVGDIIRVKPANYERGLREMDAEVVDIKELDPEKEGIPKEEIGRFYVNPHMHKVPRVFIIYVKPVPLLRNS
jgi:hypothetical protein